MGSGQERQLTKEEMEAREAACRERSDAKVCVCRPRLQIALIQSFAKCVSTFGRSPILRNAREIWGRSGGRPFFEKDSSFDLGVGPTVTHTPP